jgi:hypothetical protein
MPRVSRILAVLAPLTATILVWRTLDVSARLQLPWPFAVHPDGQDDPAQFPISVADSLTSIKDSNSHQPTAVSGETFRRRIVAVGDLHGDLPNAQKVLKMAGVVTEAGYWSGNVDFFVQTGDIIDR